MRLVALILLLLLLLQLLLRKHGMGILSIELVLAWGDQVRIGEIMIEIVQVIAFYLALFI